MTSYQSKNQIRVKLEEMIPEQVAECKECDELPPALEQLIIHNFQARFVCYDKETKNVEIGVEDSTPTNSYPRIKIHTFPLEEAISWIGKTFKEEEQDLKFYGKLIAGNGGYNKIDEVVLV